MKLSEAIRLGSTLSEQGRGHYVMDGKRCALGAAMEAIGTDVRMPWLHFSICLEPVAACPHTELPASLCFDRHTITPVGLWTVMKLGGIVVHLNDHHRWTREQIAAWVQTVEDAQEPAAEKQEAECPPLYTEPETTERRNSGNAGRHQLARSWCMVPTNWRGVGNFVDDRQKLGEEGWAKA